MVLEGPHASVRQQICPTRPPLDHTSPEFYGSSNVYWFSFGFNILLALLCLTKLIWHSRRHSVKLSPPTDVYLILGVVYGIISATSTQPIWSKAPVELCFISCQLSPLYFQLLYMLLLISFLSDVASSLSAFSSHRLRSRRFICVFVAIEILATMISATLISGIAWHDEEEEAASSLFIRIALGVTEGIYVITLLVLFCIGIRTFKELRRMVMHPNTRSNVSRVRMAFILVSVLNFLHIAWGVLDICGATILQPDSWHLGPN